MNTTIYDYHNKKNTILRDLAINFLYNINKNKIDNGLANIELNEKKHIVIFNEI